MSIQEQINTVTAGAQVDGYGLRLGVNAVRGAACKRGAALPVLSGVRVEARAGELVLTATDLEVTARVSVPADVTVPGVFVVNAKILWELVAKMRKPTAKRPTPVELEVVGDELTFSADGARQSIRLLPADEFPRLGEVNGSEVFTVDAEQLGVVNAAASSDDARPILTGVLFQRGRLVSTDSYRLHLQSAPGVTIPGDAGALVPSRATRMVAKRGGSWLVEVGEREASFTSQADGFTVTTRLIEGEFPNYRGLIPDGAAIATRYFFPDAETIRAQVVHAKTFCREVNTPVRVVGDADGVRLVAVTQDVGTSEITTGGTVKGLDLTVAFNPDYLADALAGITGPVVLEAQNAQKPAIIRSGGDVTGSLRLLMPVRIS